MYQAIGRAVVKLPNGKFTVKVEIVDDRMGRTVRFESYTVASMSALQAAIALDLNALSSAETDATLSAAVVGVVLGSL